MNNMKRIHRIMKHDKLIVIDYLTLLCTYEPDEPLFDLLKKTYRFRYPSLSKARLTKMSDHETIEAIKFYLKCKYNVKSNDEVYYPVKQREVYNAPSPQRKRKGPTKNRF